MCLVFIRFPGRHWAGTKVSFIALQNYCIHLSACQEDVERAKKEAEEAENSDSSESESSAASDGSSKSSFGVAGDDDEPPEKKVRMIKKGKAPPAPKPKSKRGSPQVAKVKKEQIDLQKSLDGAEKYLGSLTELQLHTMWKSCVRASEIDRRLGREASIISGLENGMNFDGCPKDMSDKGHDLVKSIKAEVKTVLNMKEMCRILRGSEDLASEVSLPTSSLCAILSDQAFEIGRRMAADTNTFIDVVSFVAKKLVEVLVRNRFRAGWIVLHWCQ